MLTRTTLAGAAISALVGASLGLLIDGVLVLGMLASIMLLLTLLAAYDVVERMTSKG
jgi:hypothetical protein